MAWHRGQLTVSGSDMGESVGPRLESGVGGQVDAGEELELDL